MKETWSDLSAKEKIQYLSAMILISIYFKSQLGEFHSNIEKLLDEVDKRIEERNK